MHDLNDPRYAGNPDVFFSSELLGKECVCCGNILEFRFFQKDSSIRDGYKSRCIKCEQTPWLSIAENTAMLREKNYNSEALKKQRPPWLDSMKCDIGRIGRVMDSTDFLKKLKTLIPRITWRQGAFADDLSVFLVDGRGELGYRYLWYVPKGNLPEFSIHEIDDRDVPIKEKRRGWRTPLLRCILSNMISEEDANRVFGYPPDGLASEVYRKRLYDHRNQK